MTESDQFLADPSGEPTGSSLEKETRDRLEKLYQQADLVKMLSLRPLAREVDVPEADGVDNQKEKQMALKSIEIQLHILAALHRRDPGGEMEPSLNEIWEALLQVPETGALLRRDSVRARILDFLRERLREAK